jgi:hypothetical protein
MIIPPALDSQSVLLVQGPNGQKMAYAIFINQISVDSRGQISIDGQWGGGVVWTEDIPDVGLKEINNG